MHEHDKRVIGAYADAIRGDFLWMRVSRDEATSDAARAFLTGRMSGLADAYRVLTGQSLIP